ncbi:MAG: dihydropteroate synthase [Dysgonamonadaceae bacterium]|jgi:dihydropteroate synthase|nr:dihydropteroate synthase [Dysgonamonadaceae bacterium]MDD3308410.1 dihydropteroate synthase [Dysgonamonadaceae bacterium]MDD3900168.1 dihydropteroate synthase [Dysgonamonadaceae bacterium]MDD4398902.1 dihydropteroate synthase [Dysgonamonadaceae bacterium]MEA5081027.1 dihydropteroate synthase [Dysgonamonadaceae bacterium]
MNKSLNINGSLIDFSVPMVMGIINITPDSFYTNSRKQTEKGIVQRVQQILQEGAGIVDIGGQSTTPSSVLMSSSEEIQRLEPALNIIRKEYPDAVLSIDTFYSEVARWSVEKYGVNIINDISGGQIDENMFQTVAELNVPYILMHMRGMPQNMQQMTDYADFIQEIIYYFSEKVKLLNQLGVNDIIVDPGFGFSKTLDQNYELMAYLNAFEIFDMPLLVGISRKSMIYRLTKSCPEESLNGTSVLNTFALLNGANILRVHDVKEAVECVKIVAKLKEYNNIG